MFSWINNLALREVGAHAPNPDRIADLIEARAKPLVNALEALGAEVFYSCAGHGPWPYRGEICWPKFCFCADLSFGRQMAIDLLHNPGLHYPWLPTGYFPPFHDYTLAFHLSVVGRLKFSLGRVDEDLAWLTRYFQDFNTAHNMMSTDMPAKTGHFPRAPSVRFDPMPSMQAEQDGMTGLKSGQSRPQ